MATLSSHHSDLTATQRRGLILAIVGFLTFAFFPLSRLAEIYGLTDTKYGLSVLISPYGACVLVWGVFVLLTGKRRPLKPWRALLIPGLVIAMFVGVDLLTDVQLLNWFDARPSWSELHIDTLVWNFYTYLWAIGASTYVVLGAAVRVRRWRPLLAAIGLIFSLIWLIYQYPFESQPPLFGLTFFGIVPFVIGYLATSTHEDVTPLADILLELSAAQWRGLKLIVVGLVMFAAFPAVLLAGVDQGRSDLGWVLAASTYGACVLVWGVFALRTGERRPLTPKRALWIPLVLVILFVGGDLLTRARLIGWWTEAGPGGPLGNLDTFATEFRQTGYIAAAVYAVLGAATRAEDWRWVLVSVGLILSLSWLLEIIPRSHWMFLMPAAIGLVPAIIGYRAADLSEE